MSVARKGKIYIVEDDAGVRASSRLLLEAMKFSVEDFADGESFLRETQGRPADCLLLDQRLSGMSGLELLKILREQGIQTPVIIMTGEGRDVVARAARADAVAVLYKPLAADDLPRWLDHIFSSRE